jgi:RNA polymerase sigma factor (sigma-70 family)
VNSQYDAWLDDDVKGMVPALTTSTPNSPGPGAGPGTGPAACAGSGRNASEGTRLTSDADSPDADLIQQSRLAPNLFTTIFDRHYRHIFAYAARRLGSDLAEDVASETFLIAFDRRDRYDTSRPDARPWLYGIASNLIARHSRAEFRRYQLLARAGPETRDSEEARGVDADAVDGRVDAAAVRGRLAEALTRLPEPVRDVLLLVAWAGFSCQEAADALGIPAGTARSRLHRARHDMRIALDIEVSE